MGNRQPHPEVNFRTGVGRGRERARSGSARALLSAMDIVGMTDEEKRALLRRFARPRDGEDRDR